MPEPTSPTSTTPHATVAAAPSVDAAFADEIRAIALTRCADRWLPVLAHHYANCVAAGAQRAVLSHTIAPLLEDGERRFCCELVRPWAASGIDGSIPLETELVARLIEVEVQRFAAFFWQQDGRVDVDLARWDRLIGAALMGAAESGTELAGFSFHYHECLPVARWHAHRAELLSTYSMLEVLDNVAWLGTTSVREVQALADQVLGTLRTELFGSFFGLKMRSPDPVARPAGTDAHGL